VVTLFQLGISIPYQDGERDQDDAVIDGAAEEGERLVMKEGPDGECDERDEC
ncbi:hypothetical protein TorRG33x02_149570, partial [Trema orientale]